MSPVLLGRVSGSQAFASLASLRRVSREVFDPTYVDDVFSTFLYDGTGSAQTITNGIDLSGEGGLVWLKSRSSSWDHSLFDTERGAEKFLKSSYDVAELTGGALTQFNSNGFSIDGSGSNYQDGNNNGDTYVSWSFSKAPGFFDVVTFTGTGSVQNISHSLGSVPGMIIVKKVSGTGAWNVYHRSLGANGVVYLHATFGNSVDNGVWNNTAPTSSVFTVGADVGVNASGSTYVAYVFAHDDQSFGTNSDEAIIKCGSYTGSGSSGKFIDLGFEPQWVLIKKISATGNNRSWWLADIMRGLPTGSGDQFLFPNTSGSESGPWDFIDLNPTGFTLTTSDDNFNSSSVNYIYTAIRRPNKPPTAGTDVFGISSHFTGDNSATRAITTGGVTTDLILTRMTTHGSTFNATCWTDRIRGGLSLGISSNQSDRDSYWSNLSGWHALDVMDGYKIGGTSYVYSNNSNSQYISFGIKRAPGFFDIVHYTGTGSATTITHNLNATPSVVLIKGTDTTFSWYWQHYALGANTWVQLNNDETKATNGSLFNNTLPTSSVFSVGSLAGNNGSGNKYIAYLFGDLDGISKAGTYSGTGNNINVDCGFTAGARFVLIKRTDSTGDWYMWDSTRGIVSGNDPYSLINGTAVQVTNTDYIDPLNAGFTVTSNAPAALNTSGGEYLFLAIA